VNAVKSYRSRNLSQKCQIAKTEDGVTPIQDERGNTQLDFGGLWFIKVSGAENHDRKRLLPEDHRAFFALKAKEIEEALKAEGVTDVTVTPELVYEEFVATYTKPNHTFAPPGQPEEFTLVLPKTLCVNWRGAIGSGPAGVKAAPIVAPQHTSIFARLKAARAATAATPQPTVKKPK
jgi:hypothetical protein